MTKSLKELVFEALDNALSNGYTSEGDALAVAVDLCTYDADLENYQPEQLVQFIQEWSAAKE